MTEPNRRETDAMALLLLSKMDDLHLTLTDHADTIRSNRVDLDCVIRGQETLQKKIEDHVEEESQILNTIAESFRDWAGIARWANRFGTLGKWLASIGVGTGVLVYFWDKIAHWVAHGFTKGC